MTDSELSCNSGSTDNTTKAENALTAVNSEGVFSKQVDLFCQFLLLRKRSPITMQEYQPRLAEFFSIVQKNDARLITIDDIKTYRMALEGASDFKYNLATAAVRSFFEWTTQEGITEKNFGEMLPKRRIEEKPREEFVWLNLVERKQLLGACRNLMEKLVIVFPLKTGCRNGRHAPVRREFCGIHWEDIDFEHRMIKIRGKGPGKDGKIRYIRFDEELKKLLLEYQQANGKMPVHKDPCENTKIVREVAKRAGLTKLVDAVHPFHALKHTFCTTWVVTRRLKNMPEDLRGLSEQVGTNIQTLEIYIHLADEMLKSSYEETMKALSELEGEI